MLDTAQLGRFAQRYHMWFFWSMSNILYTALCAVVPLNCVLSFFVCLLFVLSYRQVVKHTLKTRCELRKATKVAPAVAANRQWASVR